MRLKQKNGSPIPKLRSNEMPWTNPLGLNEYVRTAADRAAIDKRNKEIIRLRMQEGKSNYQIAQIMGMTYEAVYAVMGKTPVRLGGEHTWYPQMIERVRYLRECGYTINEIAEQTGVPRSTVGDWIKGWPCG